MRMRDQMELLYKSDCEDGESTTMVIFVRI